MDVGDKFDILYPGMNGNNDTGGMIKWEIVEETYWANTTTMGTTPSGKSTGETTGMTSWENTTQGTTSILTTNKNLSPSTVGSTAPTYTPNQETTLKTTTPTVIPDTTTHGSSRSIITFASFMVILFTNFVHIIL